MVESTFDLLISGGTIVDGRRNARYTGDIAVKDGKIEVRLGELADADMKITAYYATAATFGPLTFAEIAAYPSDTALMVEKIKRGGNDPAKMASLGFLEGLHDALVEYTLPG